MKSIVPLLFVGAFLAASVLHAAPKPDKLKIIEPAIQSPASAAPSGGNVIEFQGEETTVVLRNLARRAKVSMVVDSYVSGVGTVTMRVEEKTPREVIDIIVAAKGLILDENKGVLYVRVKNPPPDPPERPDTGLEDAMTSVFTSLMKMYETYLDFEARPEIAQKIAKSKKALYDALIAEGFTQDQAFRLVLAHGFSAPPTAEK